MSAPAEGDDALELSSSSTSSAAWPAPAQELLAVDLHLQASLEDMKDEPSDEEAWKSSTSYPDHPLEILEEVLRPPPTCFCSEDEDEEDVEELVAYHPQLPAGAGTLASAGVLVHPCVTPGYRSGEISVVQPMRSGDLIIAERALCICTDDEAVVAAAATEEEEEAEGKNELKVALEEDTTRNGTIRAREIEERRSLGRLLRSFGVALPEARWALCPTIAQIPRAAPGVANAAVSAAPDGTCVLVAAGHIPAGTAIVVACNPDQAPFFSTRSLQRRIVGESRNHRCCCCCGRRIAVGNNWCCAFCGGAVAEEESLSVGESVSEEELCDDVDYFSLSRARLATISEKSNEDEETAIVVEEQNNQVIREPTRMPPALTTTPVEEKLAAPEEESSPVDEHTLLTEPIVLEPANTPPVKPPVIPKIRRKKKRTSPKTPPPQPPTTTTDDTTSEASPKVSRKKKIPRKKKETLMKGTVTFERVEPKGDDEEVRSEPEAEATDALPITPPRSATMPAVAVTVVPGHKFDVRSFLPPVGTVISLSGPNEVSVVSPDNALLTPPRQRAPRSVITLTPRVTSIEHRAHQPSHGSVIPSHGSVIPSHGSVIPSHGSVIPSYGSVIPSHGSVILSHGSVIPSAPYQHTTPVKQQIYPIHSSNVHSATYTPGYSNVQHIHSFALQPPQHHHHTNHHPPLPQQQTHHHHPYSQQQQQPPQQGNSFHYPSTAVHRTTLAQLPLQSTLSSLTTVTFPSSTNLLSHPLNRQTLQRPQTPPVTQTLPCVQRIVATVCGQRNLPRQIQQVPSREFSICHSNNSNSNSSTSNHYHNSYQQQLYSSNLPPPRDSRPQFLTQILQRSSQPGVLGR